MVVRTAVAGDGEGGPLPTAPVQAVLGAERVGEEGGGEEPGEGPGQPSDRAQLRAEDAGGTGHGVVADGERVSFHGGDVALEVGVGVGHHLVGDAEQPAQRLGLVVVLRPLGGRQRRDEPVEGLDGDLHQGGLHPEVEVGVAGAVGGAGGERPGCSRQRPGDPRVDRRHPGANRLGLAAVAEGGGQDRGEGVRQAVQGLGLELAVVGDSGRHQRVGQLEQQGSRPPARTTFSRATRHTCPSGPTRPGSPGVPSSSRADSTSPRSRTITAVGAYRRP